MSKEFAWTIVFLLIVAGVVLSLFFQPVMWFMLFLLMLTALLSIAGFILFLCILVGGAKVEKKKGTEDLPVEQAED